MFFVSKTKYNELEGENFSLKMQIQILETQIQNLIIEKEQVEKILDACEIKCLTYEKIIKENIRKD